MLACWLGRRSFRNVHVLQLSLLENRAAGRLDDLVLLVEHEPVVTWGRSSKEWEIELALSVGKSTGIEVAEAERAGRLTWHGPGQLVAYPIVHLDLVGRDLHRWLDLLEQALVLSCALAGVAAHRCEGERGVWVGEKKVASVGVAVRRWVSWHGVAANVRAAPPADLSLPWCGLEGPVYGTLAAAGAQVGVEQFGWVFAEALATLGGKKLRRVLPSELEPGKDSGAASAPGTEDTARELAGGT